VPAETLIDRLWDTRPPAKARESLSVYIARLRASLRQAVGDDVQLVGRARGYELDVDPETVDLHQFRRLRRQADALVASGDYEYATELLREADGLWRGQALAGIRGDWVARMRDGLEEERRAAILERIGCELELGHHTELVGEIGNLLAQYPLDETLVAHQMTALYWGGRPADALSLYRETRSRLVDEQGTEPGPMLSELHQRILGQDPQLAARPSGQRADRAVPPNTLPGETVEFVGRRKELEQLTGEDGTPGVTIIEGMPGVGKTALAIRAARLVSGQYPDGTLYLNLHSGDPGTRSLDAAEALHRMLRMMSVPAAQIPDTISNRVALWRAQLSRRRAIVFLDDAAKPDQILPLLPEPGSSRCLILVTTRRRLADLEGVRTLTVDVLTADDAGALFRQIAGEDRTRDPEQVAEVVRLCGRLPLAIQLTAGRVAQDRRLGLDSLIEELSLSSARLGGIGAAGPEVMSAFDLSYHSLEPGHQRFFRRLGASPGASVSLHAAAALDGCTLAEAEKAIDTLLDYHLLAPASEGQFRFHDLIRGYAAVRAARDALPAEQRQAGGRLLDYYLYTADQADQILNPFRHRTPVQVTQLPAATPAVGTPEDADSWLESEWRNILQAAQYANRHDWKAKCADLAHVLAEFMEIKGYWEEAITAHTLALQASRDLEDQARTARASLALSSVHQQTGRHDRALQLAEEAAAVYRKLADAEGEADALDQAGLAYFYTARSREALAYFSEARLLYLGADDQRGVAIALNHSGMACWHLGRHAEATAHQEKALSLYREAGDRRGEAKALNNLGRIHLYSGRHRDALQAYERSLKIFREIGGAKNEAILLHNIGTVYHYKGSFEEGLAAEGSFEEGLATCRQALVIYRSIGDLPDEADVLNDIGAIYQDAECYDEALVHHQKARLIAEEIGNLYQQVIALRNVADTYRRSGQYGEALEHYGTALQLAREVGDPYEEGKILEGIAETRVSTQERAAARIAFRQALDIFEQLGVPEAEAVRIRIDTVDPAVALPIS